jgi:flagellar FliL protein
MGQPQRSARDAFARVARFPTDEPGRVFMADKAEEGEGEGKAAPKGKKKLIIIAAAALLVLGGGGGAGWFFFLKKPHVEEAPVAKIIPPVFVDLPDLLVNLTSPAGDTRARYLKAKVVLEVTDQKISDEIKPVMPRVMDAFQTFLREMRPSDLEGSAGLYRLRDELTRRVNLAVAPNKINAVLFKEIIIQ